ncbi:hypothetical protein [Azonexus hydrophilus]|uniref:hypothetical protein n=1 Tax=Azonexus hydrophilus TaxID=418702 RepID=UPI001963F4B2|nr:hypothetical protein [Azonexus hydrophilus]
MLVITDQTQTTAISNLPLRQLIEQRINERNEYCSGDPDELGPIIVIEPIDTVRDLEAVTGFSIIEGLFDDSRFGDENFAPSFEFAESHGDHLFELVYIVSDGGYGYDIFIQNTPGIDPVLLAFCQAYATQNPDQL